MSLDNAASTSTLLEGNIKLLSKNNKWKSRFCRLGRDLKSESCRLVLSIFKNVKTSKKIQNRKCFIELEHLFGMESGFAYERETQCLSILCQHTVCTIALESYAQLVKWEQCIRNAFGAGCQFNVRLVQSPPASLVHKEDASLRLHLYDGRFCLAVDKPPRIVSYWALTTLRSYGHVVNKFIFDAGTRVGPQREGRFMLLSGQAANIDNCFKLAAKNMLTAHNAGRLRVKETETCPQMRPDERIRTSDGERHVSICSERRPLLASVASSGDTKDSIFEVVDAYTNEVFDQSDEPFTPPAHLKVVTSTPNCAPEIFRFSPSPPCPCQDVNVVPSWICHTQKCVHKNNDSCDLPDIIYPADDVKCDATVLTQVNYTNQAFVESIGLYYNTQGTLNKQRPLKKRLQSVQSGSENDEPNQLKKTDNYMAMGSDVAYVPYDPVSPHKPNHMDNDKRRTLSGPDSGSLLLPSWWGSNGTRYGGTRYGGTRYGVVHPFLPDRCRPHSGAPLPRIRSPNKLGRTRSGPPAVHSEPDPMVQMSRRFRIAGGPNCVIEPKQNLSPSLSVTAKAAKLWLSKLKMRARAQRATQSRDDQPGRKRELPRANIQPPLSPLDLRCKQKTQRNAIAEDSLDLDVPTYSSRTLPMPPRLQRSVSEFSDNHDISDNSEIDDICSAIVDSVSDCESVLEHKTMINARPALRKISNRRTSHSNRSSGRSVSDTRSSTVKKGLVKLDPMQGQFAKTSNTAKLVLDNDRKLKLTQNLKKPIIEQTPRPQRLNAPTLNYVNSDRGSVCSLPDEIAPGKPTFQSNYYNHQSPTICQSATPRRKPPPLSGWSSTVSSPGAPPSSPSVFIFPPDVDADRMNYCQVEVSSLKLPPTPMSSVPPTNYAQIDSKATVAVAKLQHRHDHMRLQIPQCKRASSVHGLDTAGTTRKGKRVSDKRQSETLNRKPSF